jgi:epoxyqueuosine reductase
VSGALDLLASLAEAEGIEYWAVTQALPGPDQREAVDAARREYSRWIAEGRQGSMEFLAKHESMKYNPEAIVPGAKSILTFALGYFPGRPARYASGEAGGKPGGEAGADGPSAIDSPGPTGLISVYGRVRDYHKEFGRRIKRIAAELSRRFPDESFRGFTDTAPLHERWYAEQAGMTFTGRNTLSLHRELGSWFFLGEIISTVEFPSTPRQKEAESHCPGGCTRCIDVCPTKALEGPFRIDASKCISYLTIEHTGPIAPELMARMGNWIFGCDLCQDVCPFNIRAKVTDVEAFLKPIAAGEQQLDELLAMRDRDAFLSRFAGTPVMRAGRESMVRNALIAAGNGGHRELLPAVEELCADTSEAIRSAALWARDRLHGMDGSGAATQPKGAGED